MTTVLGYDQVESLRQGEIIRGLATPQFSNQSGINAKALALARELLDSKTETPAN